MNPDRDIQVGTRLRHRTYGWTLVARDRKATNDGWWVDKPDGQDSGGLADSVIIQDYNIDGFSITAAHLERQRAWSTKTFGPGSRLLGVLDHIRKELAEIEAAPHDLGEWVDVIILAFDGAWRAGWEPNDILAAISAKQARNEARTWPDWRTMSPDHAIEHDRTVAE
jgi:hypothetical protein